MTIVVNSLFSGAGLMDWGLQKAGLTIGQAFELDAKACKTYRANLGDHIKQCDLTQELVLDKDSCHGIVITYPCNRYSTGSDIHGKRHGDELFLHALRFLAIVQPEFYVIENVVGMRKFQVVMESMTKLPNYYVHVYCPVQSELFVPQRRDRLIIFATKRPFDVRAPQGFKRVQLIDILDKDPQVTIPQALYNRMNGHYRDRPIISDASRGDIAPCCVAHYGRDKSTRVVADKRFPLGVRPYSIREWKKLQGLDDDFHFPVSESEAYKQVGNGVTVQVAQWAGGEMKRYMQRNSNRLAA